MFPGHPAYDGQKCHYVGAGNPVVTEIVQVSAMIIRVMWTPPTEGAAVTAYIVHYRDGCGTANSLEDLPPTSTSADIKWFTTGGTLFVSVEATSQFFSGESEEKSIALRECNIIMKQRMNCVCSH